MSKDRIYFLLNEANEIVEGFINATDAWRALYQADGTRSLIAKPLPMRPDDMSKLLAKLDPDFQLPPGQFVGSTFHPTSNDQDNQPAVSIGQKVPQGWSLSHWERGRE
jgi:hypothetical protein